MTRQGGLICISTLTLISLIRLAEKSTLESPPSYQDFNQLDWSTLSRAGCRLEKISHMDSQIDVEY
jgi:hypothetical protein